MTQNWCADINNASRCCTYVNFKTLLNPEKYLNIAIPFNLRKSLACFRCSSHKLNNEIGRHYGIDKEDRICLYCFINEDNLIIEDKHHVSFNCPRYDDIRRNYQFNWYTGPTEVIYFYNIMSIDNENTIRNTALFINKLLKIVKNT